MSELRKQLYQMFILGLDGGNCRQALKEGLGGVIFFTNDIQTSEQFKNLTAELKSTSLISPFLSIDQEGGRVERTQNIHNGKKYLSAKYAFEKGTEFLAKQTNEIAQELKSYDINLNFAPCIDTNTNPLNPIIGERAFSSNPEEVILGEKIVSGCYKNNGIIPCVKHFPGHGDAASDSHLTLPVIDLTQEEMEKTHIKPFASAVKNGADMIMAAHLHCTCFDKESVPASLSENAIGYLRNILKYNGVVITDDMVMKGVQDFGGAEACEMAIRAGVDMFIFRDANYDVLDMIDKLVKKAERDEILKRYVIESDKRIQKLKKERVK